MAGVAGCVLSPCSDWVLPFALSYSLSYCPVPLLPCAFAVTAYVDLGWCLCDRVVSLWNSGDGLCWVERRVVSTVYCLLFMCCGMAVVGLCGLVVCLLLSSLCLPLPLPFCVGVRGSARAALRARTLSPNTIASLLLCSLLSVPRFSSCPAFLRYCGMAVGDSPCVGVLCWHDCDG
nr:MAG TPA: hypothetical protein [Caudoviricetes sp.]